MGIDDNNAFGRVFQALVEKGLLLESDPQLPNVCTLVTGERMRGSWWSHPMAHTIFAVSQRLADHPDVLITKLVSGKVTFVERQLWADLFAIGSARADWQMTRLSDTALALLDEIDAVGYLRTDQVVWLGPQQTSSGDATRELEKKLLVVTTQIHTESGAHAKQVESWQRWAVRNQLQLSGGSAEPAMAALTEHLLRLNADFRGRGRLPWETRGIRRNAY